MSGYEPSSHWSEVGREIRSRSSDADIAGDVAPYFRYKRQLFLQKLLPRVPVEGSEILEVGCGPGGNLRELRKRGPKTLAGCDISSEMVEIASENNPGVDIRVSDGRALPYADGEFDVVLIVTVLQHNPDDSAAQMMRQISRVSRSQVFLFEDNSPPNPQSAAGAYSNFFGRLTPWYAEHMERFGYELVRSESLETYFSNRATVFLRRLDHGQAREGMKLSRAHVNVERFTLLGTRQLDKLVPYVKDRLPKSFVPPELTMMQFRKAS